VTVTAAPWLEANQRHLVASVAVVRARLQEQVEGEAGAAIREALDELDAAAREAPAPPAIDLLADAFGLTPFERDVVVATASAELDADVARLCAAAHGDPRRNQLSFALAQAVFEDPHWSAVTPGRPLRALRLIELGPGPLPSCSLTVAERVLHYLLGVDQLDEHLQPWLTPLRPPGPLAPSHAAARDRLVALWSEPAAPVVQLLGAHAGDRALVAAAAAAKLGRTAWSVVAAELAVEPVERDNWWRLVQRELLLDSLLLVVDVPDDPAPAVLESLRRFELLAGPVVLSARAGRPLERATVAVELPRLCGDEQRALWLDALGEDARTVVHEAVSAFDLGASDIARVAASARSAEGELGRWLWEASRRETRPSLDGLAQHVVSRACWDDLVLPDEQLDAVRTIAAHASHRLAVADAFDATARGHGLIALFTGPSGTGKTLAAEVIANELGLDLFRVDLSAVVSKWIGETEKHLRTVLDAADRGSAVLLFDEADALFGKRSEVHDSHDRFANIEVGYLLQRLEAYRGIALLTTNLRSSLDSAFTRRIRYVIQFPFPGIELRTRIWHRAFPGTVEVERFDYDRLALLDLSGGSIHNIAVHASLDAAVDGTAVTVKHLRRATMREYSKLDRPLTQIEAAGLE
jgi:hypothetical protein